MSFDDKDYPNRKDWRKPYFRGARYHRSCRPNGGCGYCAGNRLHGEKKRKFTAEEKIKDWRENRRNNPDSA